MRTTVLALAIILTPIQAGCAMTPATEKAWAERDGERAAECASMRMQYMSGSCVPREGRPG